MYEELRSAKTKKLCKDYVCLPLTKTYESDVVFFLDPRTGSDKVVDRARSRDQP